MNIQAYYVTSGQKNAVSNSCETQVIILLPLWRPYLIKDIMLLERVQRRATKFILSDYSMDYKSRLINLKLLPLMYIYELTDILFTIKSFKQCTNGFDISQHLQFNESTTRSSNTKLCHKSYSNAITAKNYFCRLPRLWNALASYQS